jgi:hypothetical protein
MAVANPILDRGAQSAVSDASGWSFSTVNAAWHWGRDRRHPRGPALLQQSLNELAAMRGSIRGTKDRQKSR